MYGAIFGIIAAIALILFEKIKLWDKNTDDEKLLKITIPENLDYQTVFDDIFLKYASSYNLIKTKSSNRK
jgi:hypothetical protein